MIIGDVLNLHGITIIITKIIPDVHRDETRTSPDQAVSDIELRSYC